jgi:hypothetical protein
MYDIFFISKESNTPSFLKLKERFPLVKLADSFEHAKKRAITKFFWVVYPDLVINSDFNFDYKITEWDKDYIHIFKNGEYYDGVGLHPKSKLTSSKEIEHRFFINKKEVDIQASVPKPYDRFYINSYDEYIKALEESTTDMFWVVWNDIIINPNFKFDYYIPYYDSFHRNITHVFQNSEYYDGICLFSKLKSVSKKEFEHRFFINKKEVDIQASVPKPYDRFYITKYEEYVTALENSSTDMFWAVWPNIEILDDTIFNLYFSHHNTYDKQENHVWKNLCNDKESYISGLTLFSKTKTVSKREINYKMLINRKEHDSIASRFRYPRYYINTYEEYLEIYNTETAPLFWVIWPEVQVTDTTIFDLYYDPLDGTYKYDREENHVFQNQDIDELKYNGVMLLTTQKNPISKREINFRYIVNKKEHEIKISELRLYDIVFISYNESNADENWNLLKTRFPKANRVHGIKGIHNAHIEAARISTTPMFWVVDGDAIVNESFDFSLLLHQWDRDTVYVWRSQNPVTGLEYGYGGVKLLPRILTLNMDVNSVDMTTSISKKFKAMSAVSNITAFNTDPFSAWRSAFRECVKLSVNADEESIDRLNTWCILNNTASYGLEAYSGALAGRAYGEKNASNKEALSKINDFSWLQDLWLMEKSQLSL